MTSTRGGGHGDGVKGESDVSVDSFSESDDGEDASWISWFCSLKGNEFFVEVDEDYIHDDFNLTGLSSQVPFYEYALDTILDVDSFSDEAMTEEQKEMVETAAEMLYGLIHARYILTNRGMAAMNRKYQRHAFSRCPRVYCSGQPTVPVGESDLPRTKTVKLYCPRCKDIYYPKSSRQGNVDGAYFGTTFAHLFFQVYPDLQPTKNVPVYTPRIYGFRIHDPTRSRAEGARREVDRARDAQDAKRVAGRS